MYQKLIIRCANTGGWNEAKNKELDDEIYQNS